MPDWDITLAGEGYMLVPGSYRAGHDGIVDSRLGRQRVGDFSVGQGYARTVRGAGNERAGLLSGLGAFPAPWPMALNAVGAHPARQAISGGFFSTSAARFSASTASYYYLALGARLYRWDRNLANAPSLRTSALGATVTGMCAWNGDLYLAFDGAADVKKWNDSGSGTLTASALGTGKKSYGAMIAYGGGVWTVDVANRTVVRSFLDGAGTTHQQFFLQGAFLNWAAGPDALYIATDGGLMRFPGVWLGASGNTFTPNSWGSIAPYQSASDDYAWLLVYAGRLYTWAGKTVIYYDAAGDRWRHAGLEGSATFGAAVVNNVLYVSLSPLGNSARYELWAFNGAGWWRIESSATNTFDDPAASGKGQLVVHQVSSANAWALDLEDRYSASTLLSPFEVVTPALDAQEPDRRKFWRRVGVEFLRSDGWNVGSWDVAVSTSSDAGQSWVNAGSAVTVTDDSATVEYPLSVTANQVLVKVTVSRNSGLPPQVVAVWLEYELLNDSVRRRRWQFKVHARPKGVNRAGALDNRSGQQIRTALWALWESADTVTFRDVDDADTGLERTVRMIGLREEWPKPAGQGDVGSDTLLEVTLVEV
ncbi:MAG: hypothetical protein DCC58_07145 [Chloroflexi bacterium]|nr:MAG: hypothetical protein DCC58_07145 [Chloroflexota bacterium]